MVQNDLTSHNCKQHFILIWILTIVPVIVAYPGLLNLGTADFHSGFRNISVHADQSEAEFLVT
jgi:hypothetical protein